MRPKSVSVIGLFAFLALGTAALESADPVKTGLDVLVQQDLAPLKGKRVGVITNHTAVTVDRQHIVDVLASARDVSLAAIFTPEHGLFGDRQGAIESGVHKPTGVPIHSLYQTGSHRPTLKMLKDIDALVFDIQDVGARFYTYITTLGYAIEAAAEAGMPIYVLDRPNPINGLSVEGPLADEHHLRERPFVAYMSMPIRHGMTVGELARMFNAEQQSGADLHVVAMKGWRRSMWFDETGLEWVNQSPNIRSLTQATLYPGVCLLEGRIVWVKGGAGTPFQMIAAPFFNARELAAYLNERGIAGVRFVPRRFRPTDGVCANQVCDAIEILLLDRNDLNAVTLGVELLAAVTRFHPDQFDMTAIDRLLGNEAAARRIKAGDDPRSIVASWEGDLTAFRKLRSKYLLYQ
jgi:uncharacterized protein YbbC (DUF1343 family)